MAQALTRKITVGGINNVRSGFKNISVRTFVARVLGVAHAVESKDSNYGAYWRFSGEFQGTNKDGVIYAAPVAMLPEPAATQLAMAVKENPGGVKFGFDFFVVPDEKSNTGYVFEIIPLLEAKPSDPLAEILAIAPPVPVTQPQLADGTKTEGETGAENQADNKPRKK